MKFLLVCLVVVMSGCRDIPYRPDIGYMPSALGNSAEWPLWIQGKVCKDSDGGVGFCAVRAKEGQEIIFQMMAQQYAYTARLSCTTTVLPAPVEATIPKGQGYVFRLGPHLFAGQRYFNCTVMVTPLDRQEPIASFSRVSVLVVGKDYTRLGAPMQVGEYFVFGPHAKYVWFEDSKGKPHWLKEKTYVKAAGIRRAIVESQHQRISTHGF